MSVLDEPVVLPEGVQKRLQSSTLNMEAGSSFNDCI